MYLDYYDLSEQAPSEFEMLVDEYVTKTKEVLYGCMNQNIKHKLDTIDSLSAELQNTKEELTNARFENRKQKEEIKSLEDKCERLSKKTNTELDLVLGSKIWVVGSSEYVDVNCPTCNGTGHVKFIIDGEEWKKDCPLCGGMKMRSLQDSKKRSVRYRPKKCCEAELISISVEINKNQRGISKTVYYDFQRSDGWGTEKTKDIFTDIESCQKYCDETNEKLRNEATRILSNPITDGKYYGDFKIY